MSQEIVEPEITASKSAIPSNQEVTQTADSTRSNSENIDDPVSGKVAGAESAAAVETTNSESTESTVDYNQIYEGLQEQFSRAYSVSQKLFVTEKTQRQTLYHYKRRVNALLDVLQDLEEKENENIDEPLPLDHGRLALIVTWLPELGPTLQPALDISLDTKKPEEITLKRSYAVNLAVDEHVPELASDEIDIIEANPQDTDMWVRRNFLHLVGSKFRPAEIRAKGIREYVDPSSFSLKRKRRS